MAHPKGGLGDVCVLVPLAFDPAKVLLLDEEVDAFLVFVSEFVGM